MNLQYTVEERGPAERTLRVQVPPEEVERTLREHFEKYRSTVKIPGFRPGKVPGDIIEREFGEAIREETRWALVTESSRQILTERGITPFTSPRSDPPALKPGEAFAFDVSVEVRPEMGEITYKGLKVRKEEPAVSEFEMSEELDRLRKAHHTLRQVGDERLPRPGDIVVLDLEGALQGKPFKGGSGKDVQAEIGSGFFAPRFEEVILAMKRGERRETEFTFPADHWDTPLAGKTVHFVIHLKEIKEKLVPEMDDEFAQTYCNEKSLEGLKEKLRGPLLERAAQRIRQKMKTDLVKELVDSNKVDVPPSLLEHHRRRLVQGVARDLILSGQSKEQVDHHVRERWEELEASARREAAASLLIEHLGRKENVRLERADVEAHFGKVAALSKSDIQMVRRYYSDEGRARELAATLVEEKILDLILAHAIIEP